MARSRSRCSKYLGGPPGAWLGVSMLDMLPFTSKLAPQPYLFNGGEHGPPYTTDEHLIPREKLINLNKLLASMREKRSRVSGVRYFGGILSVDAV
jgi:hypothetical protein